MSRAWRHATGPLRPSSLRSLLIAERSSTGQLTGDDTERTLIGWQRGVPVTAAGECRALTAQSERLLAGVLYHLRSGARRAVDGAVEQLPLITAGSAG